MSHADPGALLARLAGRYAGPNLLWFTDTWHAPTAMTFQGEHVADALIVHGTYAAGTGPDWGWRIELRGPEPGKLLLEMFNITPEGQEQIAVRLAGTSAEAG